MTRKDCSDISRHLQGVSELGGIIQHTPMWEVPTSSWRGVGWGEVGRCHVLLVVNACVKRVRKAAAAER